MTVMNDSQIIDIQSQIFDRTGLRTDAHNVDGLGVLFVRESDPLTPQNVLLAVPVPRRSFSFSWGA